MLRIFNQIKEPLSFRFLICMPDLKSFVIVIPRCLILSAFYEDCILQVIGSLDLLDTFLSKLYYITFDGLKSHSLFSCPTSKVRNNSHQQRVLFQIGYLSRYHLYIRLKIASL